MGDCQVRRRVESPERWVLVFAEAAVINRQLGEWFVILGYSNSRYSCSVSAKRFSAIASSSFRIGLLLP